MKEIKNIALIGLGAIGASYAAKFSDQDPRCVKIIADQARVERLSKGIWVNNKLYNFNCVTPDQESEPADLVIIAVKFHQLEQAITDIRKHVGPDTLILSLLNGISSEEMIGRVYGMEKMLYAMCIAIDALKKGDQVRYSNFGQVHFGEVENRKFSSKVKAVKEVFDRYQIPYVIPENMMDTLWYKFMINVGINQCSAVLKAPYGIFLKVKEAGELMESAMMEVVALAQKQGIHLEREQINDFYQVLRTLGPENKTSMLQDVEAGRKTEVEMLGGSVCEMGKRYGVPTPVNEVLFKLIRTLEQQYR